MQVLGGIRDEVKNGFRLRQAFACRELRGNQEFSFEEREIPQLALLKEFDTNDTGWVK